MGIGEAYVICKNIKDCQKPDDDKGLAIYIMMNMESHNGMSKYELIEVIRYLHGMCFDVGK